MIGGLVAPVATTVPAMLTAMAALVGRPAPLHIVASPDPVAMYRRIDVEIRGVGQITDPYDASTVDVTLRVRTPSGATREMPGFYLEPYRVERRARGASQAEWLYPSGEPVWRARYTPTEQGAHQLQVTVRDSKGTRSSNTVTVWCTRAAGSGFVRASSADPRFLETQDGKPFFAVGQNVAFVKDAGETAAILRKMAAQGANFARIWTCCEDWGLALEARKSAWARSWDWKPPFAAWPGAPDVRCVRLSGATGQAVTAQPTWRTGLLPAKRYTFHATVRATDATQVNVDLGGHARETVRIGSKDTPIRLTFITRPDADWLEHVRFELASPGEVYLRDLSLREAGSSRELLWDCDPNTPVVGRIHQTDAAMLDTVVEAAEAARVRLQLCVLTRDLYMDRLSQPDSSAYAKAIADAKRTLRYAVARWGYSPAVAAWEYWNEMDPGKPTGRFYEELGAFLRKIDPYARLCTTSAWGDAPNDWNHPAIAIANMHWYMRPAEGDLYRDEVEGVLKRARSLRERVPAKPAMMAEFGLAQDNWQPSPDMRKDTRYVHLHNALWASALSGLSGTVLPWWWEDIDARDAYRCYRGVSRFVAAIPWTTAKLRDVGGQAKDARYRVIGLRNERAAYVWLSDSRATWYRQVVEGAAPEPSRSVDFVLQDWQAGAYRATWWDTDEGKPLGMVRVRSAGGNLTLRAPHFVGDIACIIER